MHQLFLSLYYSFPKFPRIWNFQSFQNANHPANFMPEASIPPPYHLHTTIISEKKKNKLKPE